MAAAYAWARPSIVSVSRVHGHTPLLGILPSGRWRLWLLSAGDRIEIDGSRYRHRLWSAAAPDASSRRGFGSSRVVTVRASHVNSAGSIDSPLMQSMSDKIKEHLNAEFVDVKDAYGDGRHVSIDVVASSFEGQTAVTRQRMVYKAIWEELQSTVHAVDRMTTRTPGEAQTAMNEGTASTDQL